jgi:hypothetical protein
MNQSGNSVDEEHSEYICWGIVVKGLLRAVFLDKTSALDQILLYYRDQGAELVELTWRTNAKESE